MIVTKAWTKDNEDGSMLPRNRLTCANHAVRIVCSRATSEELGSSETEEPGSHSINKAVPSTPAASTLDVSDAMEETVHAWLTQRKDWLDDVIALLASLLKKAIEKVFYRGNRRRRNSVSESEGPVRRGCSRIGGAEQPFVVYKRSSRQKC